MSWNDGIDASIREVAISRRAVAKSKVRAGTPSANSEVLADL